jgi:hypothetical protein
MTTVTKEPVGRVKNKTEEEARRLAISKPQLLALFHAGVVPGMRISERIILFDPNEVDEALSQHAINQSFKKKK